MTRNDRVVASSRARCPLPRIRTTDEDFEVEEIALYPPTGDGGHTFLWIEKRGTSTVAVADTLASRAGVSRRDIGFAGRKDRYAVARQWFSVPGLDPAVPSGEEHDGFRVLEARRHRHKLRLGQLSGNRFRIVVRELDEREASAALGRLAEIERCGMANRFGDQRFGRQGENAELGAAALRGENVPGSKRHRRFLVSAWQSAVFNAVLARRPVGLGELLSGDVAMVHASGGQFLIDDAEIEAPRARSFEISPTGPIHGEKMKRPAGVVADLEREVLSGWDLSEETASVNLRALRLFGTRRALRVLPTEISALHDACRDECAIELRFVLPAGSFATVLLDALFPDADLDQGPVR